MTVHEYANSLTHVIGQPLCNKRLDLKRSRMMGRTHALIGISSLWLLAAIPHTLTSDTLAPLVACAALGALLPDLDARYALATHLSVARIQPLAPIAVILSRDWGHRGATHSLIGWSVCAALMLPLALLWQWASWAALLLGYASHLAADACTKSGIPFLHPQHKRYHVLPKNWRMTTGSLAEDALVPITALAILFLLFSLMRQMQSPTFF
jgi:inner membrane protein